MNGELSTTGFASRSRRHFHHLRGGRGVDHISARRDLGSSPFLTVNESTVADEQFDTALPGY